MSSSVVLAGGTLLFITGLIAHSRPVTVGGAYVAVAALLAVVYAKGSISRIRYRRTLSSARATVGDALTLRLEIENRKPLPVLWLNCEDEVPDASALGMPATYTHYKSGRAILQNVTYLKWFERVEREFPVQCLSRGVFTLGPVKLSTGDLLGFKETSVVLPDRDTLVVYPRMAAVKGINWDERFPLGDSPTLGWINPDPLTVAGARPYTEGTPLRQVAWRATARTGEMLEKLLEPTRQRNVVVALSLSTGEHYWEGVNPELLDTAVFVCASICRDLLHRGTPFGLASNALGARSARSSMLIPPGSSRSHLLKVLEVLARVSAPWMEFYAALRSVAKETAADTGVAIIMTRQLKADWDAALALASGGRPVIVIVLRSDDRFRSYYGEVPTYLPASPVDWRTSEVISFERLD
ncbi:MAG: DUF58 domain-containing protein [Bacillota bacterium]